MANRMTIPLDVANAVEDYLSDKYGKGHDDWPVTPIHMGVVNVNWKRYDFDNLNDQKEFWQIVIKVLEDLWLG